MHPIAHTDRWRRRHDRAPGGHHREYANPGRSLQPKAPDCGSRLIPDIVSQCCGKAARLLADVTVCLLLVMAVPGLARAGEAAEAAVTIASGPIRGQAADGLRRFLGIPYAAPPVGTLRWQPPQSVAAWTAPRDCTHFGPACPQPRQRPDGASSEDCLTLNVWTPATRPGEKLPVMVWIHGGAFNFGASSQPEYDGANLARHGVVVVTINYRLGPLGFFVHPRLAAASDRHVSGNYGLLDQIAALTWVRQNIAAFGGDAGNVTIFGQSAGARSVSLLVLSPLAKGLFHRAIAQSGGPILGSEYLNPAFNGDMAAVSAMGQKLADRLGCSAATEVLACLRKKSAQEVVTAAACSTGLFDTGLFFAPVLDGRVLPDNPLTAYAAGRQQAVPMIVGSTRNEGTLYLAEEKNLTLEKYKTFLNARFGAEATSALAMFPAKRDADVPAAIDHVIAVAANAQPARFVASSQARLGVPAYLYQFTRRPDTDKARTLGAHHGADLAYVFGNMSPADGYTDTDKALSDTMLAYWVQFAKTGNPNGQGLPPWPQYESVSDKNMDFGDTVSVKEHLYKKQCDYIRIHSRFEQH